MDPRPHGGAGHRRADGGPGWTRRLADWLRARDPDEALYAAKAAGRDMDQHTAGPRLAASA